MKSPNKPSKIKAWFKNLFSKKSKSLKKVKKEKNRFSEKEFNEIKHSSYIKDNKKYTYLKTKEQQLHYKKLRLKLKRIPKQKEIKRPRLKKNQEGNTILCSI